MTSLFLIYARDPNNESLDLAVEASTVKEAEKLWRDWVSDDFGSEVDEKDFVIYRVPQLTGRSRVLEWNDLDGLMSLKDTRS